MWTLTNLPEDIIYALIQYLPANDFLAFCASSKVFQHNDKLCFSESYWTRLTRSNFRTPIRPLVVHDGRGWKSLYRRMLTQTKVYGWGKNDGGCLGGGLEVYSRFGPMDEGRRAERGFSRRTWPSPSNLFLPESMKSEDWGFISDLQCTVNSVTALNSKGTLFTVGVIDDVPIWRATADPISKELQYPPGFVRPAERYDPFTAVKQFSAGRSHILGLTDSGRIWSWDDKSRPGLHVKFLTIDLVESQATGFPLTPGCVTQVVAGGEFSSAYIVGTGIVLWTASNNAEIQGQSDLSAGDGMLVLESTVIPLTGYRLSMKSCGANMTGGGRPDCDLNDVGQVVNWIVLTRFVVFLTTNGKLFASKVSTSDDSPLESICLNANRNFSHPDDSGDFVTEVQGGYERFGVFKRDGSVLISHVNELDKIWNAHNGNETPPPTPFTKLPCLQNAGVISLAFGDHHYHALHSDGTITSYGTEFRWSGAMGLGGANFTTNYGAMRGLVDMGDQNESLALRESRGHNLPPQCYHSGRRVLFDPERRAWLKWIGKSILNEVNFETEVWRQLIDQIRRPQVVVQISEWIEERLRLWSDELPPSTANATADADADADDDDDDGIPAYCAVGVAAGGLHSAALVLVDEAKAARARRRCTADGADAGDPVDGTGRWIWQPQRDTSPRLRRSLSEEMRPETKTFPRLRLANGELMGGVDPDETREVLDVPRLAREGSWMPVEAVAL